MSFLLSLMIIIPVVGAVFQAIVPKQKKDLVDTASGLSALISSSLAGFIGIFFALVIRSNWVSPGELTQKIAWLSSYSIYYEVGVDGLNLLLVLGLSLLFPILIASEWKRESGRRGIQGLLLLLQSALFGTVCSYDLFLQFFFWSLSALLIYFLVGMWGGRGRERTAVRYAVNALLGNAALFVALLLVYYAVDPHTFSIQELSPSKLMGKNLILFGKTHDLSSLVFLLACAGMVLRLPVWPVHGWLSDLAERAPQSVVAAIYGGMIPVGFYVFLRQAYVLYRPDLEIRSNWMIAIGILSMTMGALGAVGQRQLRGLLAQLCLVQSGFSLIGIASLSATGLVGAMIQSVAVGLGLAGLALFVESVLSRVKQDYFKGEKACLSGFAKKAPVMALFSGVFMLTVMNMPASGSFVGASLLMVGGYSVHPMILLAAVGMIFLMSVSLLSMYRRVFFGQELNGGANGMVDLSFAEKAYLIPLVLALLVMGFYPKPIIEIMHTAVAAMLAGKG